MNSEFPRHEIVWPEVGVTMPFRWVSPGRFRMGSRGEKLANGEPNHLVEIKEGFWLGETPITQG